MTPFVPDSKVIQNAILIPEKNNRIVQSVDVHDYINTVLDDGKEIMIDGGRDYFHAGGHFELFRNGRVIDLRLTTKNIFTTEIAQKLLWGTRGKSGKEPLKWVFLKDCEADHLLAILQTQDKASVYHRLTCLYWYYKKTNKPLPDIGTTAVPFISGVCDPAMLKAQFSL